MIKIIIYMIIIFILIHFSCYYMNIDIMELYEKNIQNDNYTIEKTEKQDETITISINELNGALNMLKNN